MEPKEIQGLVISALAIAFVFSYSGLNLEALIKNFPLALIGVSTGFILHELGHRTVAKHFHAYAEFVMWKTGLLIAVVLAVLTNGAFTFAAPGAVMISERHDLWGQAIRLSKKRLGLISIAGPLMNLILFSLFMGASFFVMPDAFRFAAQVNLWLGLFNLIPFPPLDGFKIFAWDKHIWIGIFLVFLALFLVL
ncbi:MAG: site-2 protease family protein [Candidatus Aenigmarchaeota archaeon]|nr:site-2 protease family protein [Candidatus Aenigmarchaeota archaeon]